MIPKVIHYCWFGRNPKSELIQKCIASWREFCPDYEIIEWNEGNFDVNFCDYTIEAYEAGKWAFVSDVARLKVVYDHGGIYLDTDVELKKGLDDLLGYDAWFAQDDIRYINTGLGFGACKGYFLLGQIIEKRIKLHFDINQPCDGIDTPVIRETLKLQQSRESQCIDNTYIIGMLEYGQYAKHWALVSWKDEGDWQLQDKRRGRFWKLKCWLRNPKLINRLERNGQTVLSKVYVFISYDLLDNGIWYFVKRLLKKIFK